MLMKLQCTRKILKNVQISNFMKISAVGAKLFHADRRTDRHEASTDFLHSSAFSSGSASNVATNAILAELRRKRTLSYGVYGKQVLLVSFINEKSMAYI
jgi:hypothetical protein